MAPTKLERVLWMGFVLRGNRGFGDHAAEDWARGLCKLLPDRPEVVTPDLWGDIRYGAAELGGVFGEAPVGAHWYIDAAPMDLGPLRRQGARTVLYGWSPGKLTGRVLRQLRQYDLVVATEERSHRRLTHAGLGSRLRRGPDPAFLVDPAPDGPELPGNTVALCLSLPPEASESLFDCWCRLVSLLLAETDRTVALVPYQVDRHCNDLLLHRALLRQLGQNRRLILCGNGPSPMLRGILSRCRCCIGFEGAVAAWSCGVPALCLSDTDRTCGLAGALFGCSAETVADWRQPEALPARVRRFLALEERYRSLLRQRLRELHPSAF